MAASKNLLNIRGNIAFTLGLLLAVTLAYSVENRINLFSFSLTSQTDIKTSALQMVPVSPSPLSAQDEQVGRIAWQYFVNNTQENTGLANAVDGFPSATLWDQASYLLGMIAAYRLGIVEQAEFDQRLTKALISLNTLPLFQGSLPNKVYDTTSMVMTDYTNTPTGGGIGWSALDIARLLVPLEIIGNQYPAHAPPPMQL